MASKQFLKRMLPMVMAGAMAFVMAMPIKAMAHEWEHHDNGRHLGWFHHDRDDDDCDFNRGGFYPRSYYPAPSYQMPGFYGYGNNPRMNYLQQKWAQAEAKHQAALARGNRYAAKVTSKRLYELDRMGAGGGYGTNGYYNNGYYNNGYYNSQLGPMIGNMLGLW